MTIADILADDLEDRVEDAIYAALKGYRVDTLAHSDGRGNRALILNVWHSDGRGVRLDVLWWLDEVQIRPVGRWNATCRFGITGNESKVGAIVRHDVRTILPDLPL